MLPEIFVILTGRPFRSGASWSQEHACVPRHSLAVHSQVLIAAQRWLVSSIFCSPKPFAGAYAGAGAGTGAGAATACCMATCMELLVWTQLTQAGHSSSMKWTSLLIMWMPWDNGTACSVRGSLRRTWCAASWPLASQLSTSSTSFSSFLDPCGLCQILLLPVLAACSCDAASQADLQHLHSISQPLSGLIFIVNLSDHFLRGPAVVLSKRPAGVALPWAWGCMPSVPRSI